MTKDMTTRQIHVVIADSVEDGPTYGKETPLLKVSKAVVIPKGTRAGKASVDIQLEGTDGKQYVIMATGGVIKMLTNVINGVDSRDD